MQTISASTLSALVNGFRLSLGPPRAIIVPRASALAKLQDVTVSGRLLKKQLTTIDPKTNKRTWRLGSKGTGQYEIEKGDGDLHFCLGTQQSKPHIPCELQEARAALAAFQGAVGKTIQVSGFFRCLFEHSGFFGPADAHIFEIHPVGTVNLGAGIIRSDVAVPEPAAVHPWGHPVDPNDPTSLLNPLDAKMRVRYDRKTDTLTFTGMGLRDHNYVSVTGTVTNVQLRTTSLEPATFTFTSPDIPKPKTVLCLKGSKAYLKLRALPKGKPVKVDLIGLRNIDLNQALQSRYVINLLGIDIHKH